jgi:NADP-dependent 3-hydroxy acid dehydrogenase YdfG
LSLFLTPSLPFIFCITQQRDKIMNNSANKVVVITGASSGIGQAIALHLANKAFSLVLVARRLDRINALVDQIIQQGGKAIAVNDVTRQEEVQRAIDAAVPPTSAWTC